MKYTSKKQAIEAAQAAGSTAKTFAGAAKYLVARARNATPLEKRGCMMNIYEAMTAAGVVCSSHYSDLHVPVNAITSEIIGRYEFRALVTTFRNQVDHAQYYDIPFAFQPYWDQKGGRL
jgi:hypothetical protein